MKETLLRLLNEKTIEFTKNQIDFMIANIGSTDKVLRDNTILRYFVEGFMEKFFKFK